MDSPGPRNKGAHPSQEMLERIREPRVGWVVGAEPGAKVLVDFPGNALGPLPARTTLSLDEETLVRAAAQRQGALLLFENGDPSLPLLVGLLQTPSETPLLDALLAQPVPEAPQEVEVDGKRVVIEGRDEIVLRCGKASLTLRRNGQVLLRGVNIRTEADELQRIKGGKVQIN